ncbi:hypothetical protein D3C76_1495710 [compost metagenome]
MRLQVVYIHTKAQVADTTEWAQYADAVVQVHQAKQREWEGLVGQQLHLQREGHHVWEGWRQASIVAEMTEFAVSLQPSRLDFQVTAQTRVRQGTASDLAFAGGT